MKMKRLKQTLKKTIAMLSAFAIVMGVLGVLPLTVMAVPFIDLSVSPFPPSGTGWTYAGGVFTILDGANVTVTGSTSGTNARRIVVEALATATITLDGANIDLFASNNVSPIWVQMGASLTLNLAAGTTNTMSGAGVESPGIRTSFATLTITGSGTLTANGSSNSAGIGGFTASTGGNITITDNATVNANGGFAAAGIGGGTGGAGGNITISGNATVNANGGESGGAGIGGGAGGFVPAGGAGGTITISGNATVNATGGNGTIVPIGGTDAPHQVGGGAGIGGGGQAAANTPGAGAGGIITISDTANVTVVGGDALGPDAQGGAGIGGGGAAASGPVGTITTGTRGGGAIINDTAHIAGVLNATGGTNGANIGGTAPGLHREATVTFNPASVAISDANLSQSVGVGGTASSNIAVSYTIPPALQNYIDVIWAAGTPSVTVTGVRPAAEGVTAVGSFNLYVTRDGVTEYFAVTVNLTSTFVRLSGTVMISGNSVFGETLTANTAGLSTTPTGVALGTFSFAWYRTDGTSSTQIAGATSNVYTLTQADIGYNIYVIVTSANTQGYVSSAQTAVITRAAQDAPALSHSINFATYTATITPVAGAEYRFTSDLDATQEWSAVNTFVFTYGAELTLEIRLMQTATHYASQTVSLIVTPALSAQPQQAATPTATPNSRVFTSSVSVTLATATPNAEIFFTRDGSIPTSASTLFTAPIVLTNTTTIRAIAIAPGMADSELLQVTFTRQQYTPPPTSPDWQGPSQPPVVIPPVQPPEIPATEDPVVEQIQDPADDPTEDLQPIDPPYGVEPQLVQRVLRLTIGSAVYTIDGVSFVMDAIPYVANGRTMVPLRFVAEAMGADVSWNREAQTVTVTQEGFAPIVLVIGVPLPDGLGMPEVIDGRTFIPFRFISQSLGASVRWDSAAQAVYVYFYV